MADAPARGSQLGFLVDDQLKVAYQLLAPSTRIGRDASNDIVVRDPTASRFHAEVKREAAGFVLQSMGARGTTVNDKPLTASCQLADGDIVEIAFTTLRFTNRPPPGNVTVAPPHSGQNDEYARKATLEAGIQRVLVSEHNEAGRSTRRLLTIFALIAVAGLIWWLLRGR